MIDILKHKRFRSLNKKLLNECHKYVSKNECPSRKPQHNYLFHLLSKENHTTKHTIDPYLDKFVYCADNRQIKYRNPRNAWITLYTLSLSSMSSLARYIAYKLLN